MTYKFKFLCHNAKFVTSTRQHNNTSTRGKMKLGFLDFGLLDVMDILIVGYLLFTVYKLLKGSLALNIFLGLVMVYGLWWLVDVLNMDMLSLILNQVVSVGVILLLIVFQPEVRRFLLFLGRGLLERRSNLIGRLFQKNLKITEEQKLQVRSVREAVDYFSKNKVGALIVFTQNPQALGLSNIGTLMNANISAQLLETIFYGENPMHDGAVIVSNETIYSAGAILPVSERTDLPIKLGLRHRAAVGITEGTSVLSLVVSEETGHIAFARNGHLTEQVSLDNLERVLKKLFSGY